MNWLFYSLWVLLSLWAVYRLLIDKREPSATLSWLLFVILAPIVGSLLFFVFGPQRLERAAIKRKEGMPERIAALDLEAIGEGRARSLDSQLPIEDRQVIQLAKQISEYPMSFGNKVEILSDPQAAFNEMESAIALAKHFIHLEYYIIASDEVTEHLFDSLIEARARDVEVRILYDALGSLSLKKIFFRKLTEKGIKIKGFLPLSAFPQRLHLNFRNHRKILIVDGLVAFTGSANIGRQYLGQRTDSQWRDNLVRVEGPVCGQLEDVFARDWQFTTEEDLFRPEYYPKSSKIGDSLVQVLESGPDTSFHTLHQALFLAINSAQDSVFLTTPYFIPDSDMMSSLTVAKLRGVDVKLLLPSKSDSRFVQYASRSFYEDLLRVGASIYEYQPKVLHAKMLIIDGKWTILGSFNMDIRSFRLNFELNLLIYGMGFAKQSRDLFEEDLQYCKGIELGEFNERPIYQKMMENAARLLSPIL